MRATISCRRHNPDMKSIPVETGMFHSRGFLRTPVRPQGTSAMGFNRDSRSNIRIDPGRPNRRRGALKDQTGAGIMLTARGEKIDRVAALTLEELLRRLYSRMASSPRASWRFADP